MGDRDFRSKRTGESSIVQQKRPPNRGAPASEPATPGLAPTTPVYAILSLALLLSNTTLELQGGRKAAVAVVEAVSAGSRLVAGRAGIRSDSADLDLEADHGSLLVRRLYHLDSRPLFDLLDSAGLCRRPAVCLAVAALSVARPQY